MRPVPPPPVPSSFPFEHCKYIGSTPPRGSAGTGGESAYHVWAASSVIGSGQRSHYILAMNLLAPYKLDLARLARQTPGSADSTSAWVVFDVWAGPSSLLQLLTAASPDLELPACPQISVNTLGHTLWAAVPVLPGGWVLLGEVGKIVAVASRRFSAVAGSAAAGLAATVLIAPKETIEVVVGLTATAAGPGQARSAAVAAVTVSCAAGVALGGLPDRFGDVDVAMSLTCTAAVAAVPKCLCKQPLHAPQ